MKKEFSTLCFCICSAIIIFTGCKKLKPADQELSNLSQPGVYLNDEDRDKHSADMVRIILNDPDWKALAKLNYEFIDELIRDGRSISQYASAIKEGEGTILMGDEYNRKLGEAKLLAGKLKNRYFSNTKECISCMEFTEDKWQKIEERINSFRSDEKAYRHFLRTIGVNEPIRMVNVASEGEVEEPGYDSPNCNNWRFTLCAAACVITAPTTVLFAACLALCVAEYC